MSGYFINTVTLTKISKENNIEAENFSEFSALKIPQALNSPKYVGIIGGLDGVYRL